MSWTLTPRVIVPPTASTVNVEIPVVAVADAVSVNTVEPEPGAARMGEEKTPATPAGKPLTVKFTGRLKLFVRVPVVSVTLAVPVVVAVDWRTVSTAAEAVRLNAGATVT